MRGQAGRGAKGRGEAERRDESEMGCSGHEREGEAGSKRRGRPWARSTTTPPPANLRHSSMAETVGRAVNPPLRCAAHRCFGSSDVWMDKGF